MIFKLKGFTFWGWVSSMSRLLLILFDCLLFFDLLKMILKLFVLFLESFDFQLSSSFWIVDNYLRLKLRLFKSGCQRSVSCRASISEADIMIIGRLWRLLNPDSDWRATISRSRYYKRTLLVSRLRIILRLGSLILHRTSRILNWALLILIYRQDLSRRVLWDPRQIELLERLELWRHLLFEGVFESAERFISWSVSNFSLFESKLVGVELLLNGHVWVIDFWGFFYEAVVRSFVFELLGLEVERGADGLLCAWLEGVFGLFLLWKSVKEGDRIVNLSAFCLILEQNVKIFPWIEFFLLFLKFCAFVCEKRGDWFWEFKFLSWRFLRSHRVKMRRSGIKPLHKLVNLVLRWLKVRKFVNFLSKGGARGFFISLHF